MASITKDIKDLKELATKISVDPTTELSSIKTLLKVINIFSGSEDRKFNRQIIKKFELSRS